MSRKKLPVDLRLTILYKSARTCCVCRVPHKGFQIHHIDEDRNNNVESNLAVLCQDCHDEAHTNRKLSQNLRPEDIVDAKKRWESEVSDSISRSMLPSVNPGPDALWTYINHDRIFALLKAAGITYKQDLLGKLVDIGAMDEFGVIQPLSKPSSARGAWSVYDYLPHHLVHTAHHLYTSAIDDLILNVRPIEVDAIWRRRDLKAILTPGTYIYSLRGYHFKDYEEDEEGHFSMRLCHTKKSKIKIEFRVSTRDMFGDSAVYDSFYNHRVAATLLLFKSFSTEDGVLILHCTPVAMGVGFWKEHQDSPVHSEHATAEQVGADQPTAAVGLKS